MSHKAVGALALNINLSILNADNNKKKKKAHMFEANLHKLLRCHSFSLDHSYQNLGQRSLTWYSHLHTKKNVLPPPFLFVCVNCFWPRARKPASACACCATFPHQSTPPSLIPSCPWRKTKLACLFNEERSSERGEGALFPHTLKFSGFNQRARSSSSTPI